MESKGFDFGDAPLTFSTTIADDGAVHEARGPRLGDLRDTEADGVPSVSDDNANDSDEDGVMFGTIGIGSPSTLR